MIFFFSQGMMYRPFSVRAALAVLVCILSVGAASVVTKLTEDVKATPGNQRWALLIAGSRGWGNYRHQADVCHAYHTLRRGGVPKEQIIVMMADDIANSTHNPQKGVIINRPGGPNVYPGVVMDYTGTQVTAKNMLRVLAGDAEAMQGIGSGKVLATGPGDMVFVYYADHGGTLVLGTPSGPFLRAHDLVDTLKAKAAKSGFRKMTLYVEACESGSIFSGLLPGNLSIYVTTAANQTESSWATYCPPHSGPLNVCLGDLYSVSWLENADVVDPRETLEAQYEAVKARTADRPKEGIRGSHVMQWGQLNYTDESIGDFTGYEENRCPLRPSGVPPLSPAVCHPPPQIDGRIRPTSQICSAGMLGF